MNKKKSILVKGHVINEKYSVNFFLKKGGYAETYRVQNEAKETKFLKLFDYSKLHRTQFTSNDDILEIEMLKQIKHPNLVKYNDHGNIIISGQKFAYVVLDFVSGETLADKMKRENVLNLYEAKDIILSTLNGLNYLHNKQIIHNDITTQNIMLDLSGKVSIPRIIDFGYARFIEQSNKDFLKDGLNLFYTANETFNKVFSFQSDIYSVGALYYHLLTGLPPYFIETSKYKSNQIVLEDAILEERKKPLKFSDKINEQTQNIIRKALHSKAEQRFKSAKEFIQALNGELEIELSIPEGNTNKVQEKKRGKGFSAIAGMQELKDTIQLDVIDALHDQVRYAEYGLTIPNGMLLYGPPGCGKTFFAERMAEEIGFNFYQIKPSDIQSKWVNASQENVKNLFDEARKNTPSIIFIDELDALVPNRENTSVNHMNTSVVNEFLAQMNNSGEEGVFVIGATNKPNSIDPAILRAGRMDKKIYLPVPDFEARIALFKLYLSKIKQIEIGINNEALALKTENYASVDIKNICDEAARKALKRNTRVSFVILEDTINKTRPSSTLEELNRYMEIKKIMEGQVLSKNDRSRIGFK
ncbi:AAA family ATPase [Bacteroides sp.]|uniref:AAA family ATPase n=1 Tax=Bacteroides sp. TaxID=29523 RepID=UPI001B483755|nr:AAA family ATPase [Bacteroides sp.]MBP6936730.1 AAA family ATPase [Bacteroides sp.]MBP9585693.1 AAA family ATPase [Bacteroides sp.]